MSVIRAFIAIELSPQIHQQIDQVSQELQNHLLGVPVRWVPGKNIHLTLKFLGDVSEENVEVIKKMLLAEAGSHPQFAVSIGEVGAFPSSKRPRVVWIGVSAPPELGQLQHRLEAEAAHLGYPPEERPFSPHLTLGRVGRNVSSSDQQRIGQVLSEHPVGFLGVDQVHSICLFRSDLKPEGAVYSRLFSASLQPVGS